MESIVVILSWTCCCGRAAPTRSGQRYSLDKAKAMMCIRLLLLGLLGVSAVPEWASACSCILAQGVAEEVERSHAVFVGTIVEHEEIESPWGGSRTVWLVHFSVSKAWKGVTEAQFTTYTEKDGAACGYAFELDQEYLVYAYWGNDAKAVGYPALSVCSRSRPLGEATENLVELGEPPVSVVTPTLWGRIKALFLPPPQR